MLRLCWSHQNYNTDINYDMMWYDAWSALENWQASCPFNLAQKLKRTENVLKGNEMRETEMEVPLCKT